MRWLRKTGVDYHLPSRISSGLCYAAGFPRQEEHVAARGASMMAIVTVGVLILVVLSTGLVTYTSLSSADRSIDELWLELGDSTGDQTVRRTMEVLQPVVPHATLTQSLLRQGQLSPERPEQLLEYLLDSLQAQPDVTWMSWGQPDGTFLAAMRWPDRQGGTEFRRTWRTLKEPGGVSTEDAPAMSRWRTWKLADDGTWRSIEDGDRPYDPRARPWYQAAMTAKPGQGAWIEPYIMLSRQQPGVGYARACHGPAGKLLGVLAAEFEAEPLSRFLGRLKLGETGRVYLVTDKKLVVAHPAGEVLDLSGPVPRFFEAPNHPDAMLRTAYRGFSAQADGRAREVDGYLVTTKAFPKSTGIPWWVVAAVPAEEFFGDAHSTAEQAAITALIAALIALLLGLFLSRRLASTVVRVESQLNRIADFDLNAPDLGDSPSFLREVNVMAAATDRMKHGLRSFARYIPHQLVRQLMRSGGEAKLGGEMRELTVLFSDIEGFTTIVEDTSPDVVVGALGDYLGAMNDAIHESDGTVCQYLGDAVMAFWGAPEAYADHAVRACRGALAMRAAAEALVDSAEERQQPALPTRFGLNSGDVMVGNIGAPDRFNYGIVGDPVNTASRIEGLNKVYGTRILVGQRTAALVGDAMVLRPVDWVRMKGKQEPVLVYELVGEPAALDPAVHDAMTRYAEALHAYKERRFAEAQTGFEAVDSALADQGGDPPSRVMAKRAAGLLEQPPPEDWDGTHHMRMK